MCTCMYNSNTHIRIYKYIHIVHTYIRTYIHTYIHKHMYNTHIHLFIPIYIYLYTLGSMGKYPDTVTMFDADGASRAYITKIKDATYTTTTTTTTATSNSNNNVYNSTFIFDINKAVYMPYYKTYKHDVLCVEIGENKDVNIGEYILTIVPLVKEYIMISYLILP